VCRERGTGLGPLRAQPGEASAYCPWQPSFVLRLLSHIWRPNGRRTDGGRLADGLELRRLSPREPSVRPRRPIPTFIRFRRVVEADVARLQDVGVDGGKWAIAVIAFGLPKMSWIAVMTCLLAGGIPASLRSMDAARRANRSSTRFAWLNVGEVGRLDGAIRIRAGDCTTRNGLKSSSPVELKLSTLP